MGKTKFKVGDYVRFIDPAIFDYDKEDRKEVLNTIFKIEKHYGDIYLLCTDNREVEALKHEMEKVNPMYFVDFDWYDTENKLWHGDLGYEAGINDFMSDTIVNAIIGITSDIDDDCLGLIENDNQIAKFSIVEGVYDFICEDWECPPCTKRQKYVRYTVLACSKKRAEELGLEADLYYPMPMK